MRHCRGCKTAANGHHTHTHTHTHTHCTRVSMIICMYCIFTPTSPSVNALTQTGPFCHCTHIPMRHYIRHSLSTTSLSLTCPASLPNHPPLTQSFYLYFTSHTPPLLPVPSTHHSFSTFPCCFSGLRVSEHDRSTWSSGVLSLLRGAGEELIPVG